MVLVGTGCLASPRLQVRQLHSEVALQATPPHPSFSKKTPSCVNSARQNEDILDLEPCIIDTAQCPRYTFYTDARRWKAATNTERLLFCRLQTLGDTL